MQVSLILGRRESQEALAIKLHKGLEPNGLISRSSITLQAKVPSFIRNLTDAYRFSFYWWEIVECARSKLRDLKPCHIVS